MPTFSAVASLPAIRTDSLREKGSWTREGAGMFARRKWRPVSVQRFSSLKVSTARVRDHTRRSVTDTAGSECIYGSELTAARGNGQPEV